MVELILSSKNNEQIFSLEKGNSWTIGRSDDCDIFLNDSSISRRHCKIIRDTHSDFSVTDNASSAGTFVNNIRIKANTPLDDGDELRVGGITLNFCMTTLANQRMSSTKSSNQDLTIVGNVDKPIAASRHNYQERSPDIDLTIVGHIATPVSTNGGVASAVLSRNFPLKPRLVLGRASECDVLLDSPGISRFHAELLWKEDGRILLRDLDSANGTFVNGAAITATNELGKNAVIRIGPFIIRLSGNSIKVYSEQNNAKLVADKLTKTVISRDSGLPIKLIDQVSLVINPREFVALLGGSGSGKSTLMDALNGRRPPSTGRLLVNDEDFYVNYRYFKTAIAYVPQKDIVHLSLTVFEAFCYAARLRLPADTKLSEIEESANQVIETLGLKERKNTIIGNLSGGQLKRVSLGVELLADPSLVYLDEATSGLDAGTEAQMMSLFRELADSGKTVICITHNY